MRTLLVLILIKTSLDMILLYIGVISLILIGYKHAANSCLNYLWGQTRMNERTKEWMGICNVYFTGCFNMWFSWYTECRHCCEIVTIQELVSIACSMWHAPDAVNNYSCFTGQTVAMVTYCVTKNDNNILTNDWAVFWYHDCSVEW